MTAKWSKRKTLSRNTSFRPIEIDDLKYAFAAYRSGEFRNLVPEGLSADEFKDQFGGLIAFGFDEAWTMIADTRRGLVPAGFAVGFYPHPGAEKFLILDSLIWLPWATPRNRLECAVRLFSRNDIPMIGFVRAKDKKFCETIAKHGLFRRVGTSMNVFGDEPAAIWETKANGKPLRRASNPDAKDQ